MKKLLSFCLVIAIIICMVPMGAFTFTTSALADGYYIYTVSDDEATITNVNTSISGDITIPDTFGGYPVTSIGDEAFSGCSSLTSITIPDSVTSIGYGAFYDCTSLTSITIPDSVTSIGNSAFHNCTSLTSITIPDSVTSIGNSAFHNCTSLISVTNAITGECRWSFENGMLTVYGNGEMDDYNLVYGYPDSPFCDTPWKTFKPQINNIVIQDGVTSIGDNSFYDCDNITNVVIPNSVKSIGIGAFSNSTNLANITISDGVNYIGLSAFKNCDSLTSIIIPKGVSVFCSGVFADCDNLTDITVPNTIAIIENGAFDNCPKLTNVWYMGTEDRRSYIAFYDRNNQLLNANWHYNSCVGSEAHIYDNGCDTVCNVCSFVREPIHNYNAQNVCGDCGYNKLLDYIEYEIENNEVIITYCDYSITGDYVIPSEIEGYTVTSIERNAFFMCRRLKNITIPNSITNIGDWAFDYCYGLTNIYYQGNETQRTKIMIGEGNQDLSNATWHYDCCLSIDGHVYDDDSDDTCNNCGFVRDTSKIGDVNGDNKINGRDYAMLIQFINGWDVAMNAYVADLNSDGKINGRDYAMLIQLINGWDVELK